MIQRWDDLTPEEQQRYTDNEQLRALLAERTTALEQLQMALHVKHAQLTTITAERDNYRSKFRDLEHELQLERGQIVAMQQRTEAAETELAAVPWRAIAHMLDNVATDEDRQTVALWHLAKWGF